MRVERKKSYNMFDCFAACSPTKLDSAQDSSVLATTTAPNDGPPPLPPWPPLPSSHPGRAAFATQAERPLSLKPTCSAHARVVKKTATVLIFFC